MATKPILFNTDMVRAILEGRKTVTRRVVKPHIVDRFVMSKDGRLTGNFNALYPECGVYPTVDDAPYQPCDILYAPEAWKGLCSWVKGVASPRYGYAVKFKGGEETEFYFDNAERAKKWQKYLEKPKEHWQSPYFMPKEAARIFLRVMDVRAERLQGITVTGLQEEGLLKDVDTSQYSVVSSPDLFSEFQQLWDSTIKPADRTLYGWLANPWVWVIEFERISREEAMRNA